MLEQIAVNYSIILRLVVALILGGIIGIEREISYKPAGLRTHMLVSVGATLFTIVSLEGFGMDPARIAAGIVTGIGFIGAGTIIAEKGEVHGITTAASIWTAAAIGLGVGSSMYFLSIVTAILVFIILMIGKVDKYLRKK